MVSSQVSLDSPVSWKQHSFGSKRRMQIAGRPVNADGQGPDGCLALFLHQRALQNSAAPLGHTERYKSPPFPSEMQIFPSAENQSEGGRGFWEADSNGFSLGQFLLQTPQQREKGQGDGGRTFGAFPLSSALTFCLECKANHFPWKGSPGATTAPHSHWGVTSGVSHLGCHLGVSPLGARGSQRGSHDCHETPVKHRQVHQGGTKKWKNDCRKPQKKYNLLFNVSQALPWGRDVTRACEVSGSGSTEQVGNGTFTVQMAESAAFLPLLVYTQEQNAGKYLILVLLSRRFFTEDTPGPARQSVQTCLYQRVTQVQPASAQGITFPLPEGAHKHLREVTAACFAFCPPPISPAECQCSNPANASNLLLEH